MQPKKLLIVNILDILRHYSDAEHRLTQKDIENLLFKEYSMKADRKSIKRNLMNLVDFGYEICYTEIERDGKHGEETICTDWYMEREFSDAELRLLIDSLLFSKQIPFKQCQSLIEKLKGLSNNYFSAKVKHICNLPENTIANPQLFYTIDILDEAIEKRHKVRFAINEVNYQKHRIKRTDDNGNIKKFAFNPYQMVATNGRYYLIGNFDYYDNIAYIRLDHISDIELLDSRAKPMKQVKGLEKGLHLPQHMAEHIYMLYGEAEDVKFRCPQYMSDQLIDWFGTDFNVTAIENNEMIVSVKVNARAMKFWALQYGNFVEVLEPKSLREDIKKSITNMVNNYGV